RSVLTVGFVLLYTVTFSQTDLEVVVRDAETQELLPGATASIRALGIGASADESGRLRLEGVPAGKHIVEFSFVGYAPHRLTLTFPYRGEQPFSVTLKEEQESLEEIVIASTRSSRTIADIPTRVELIAGE